MNILDQKDCNDEPVTKRRRTMPTALEDYISESSISPSDEREKERVLKARYFETIDSISTSME